jgi:hypothetical protein
MTELSLPEESIFARSRTFSAVAFTFAGAPLLPAWMSSSVA